MTIANEFHRTLILAAYGLSATYFVAAGLAVISCAMVYKPRSGLGTRGLIFPIHVLATDTPTRYHEIVGQLTTEAQVEEYCRQVFDLALIYHDKQRFLNYAWHLLMFLVIPLWTIDLLILIVAN